MISGLAHPIAVDNLPNSFYPLHRRLLAVLDLKSVGGPLPLPHTLHNVLHVLLEHPRPVNPSILSDKRVYQELAAASVLDGYHVALELRSHSE